MSTLLTCTAKMFYTSSLGDIKGWVHPDARPTVDGDWCPHCLFIINKPVEQQLALPLATELALAHPVEHANGVVTQGHHRHAMASAVDDAPLARTTDPASSHRAGESIRPKREGVRQRVLGIIAPVREPISQFEIIERYRAKFGPAPESTVRTRISELVTLGSIVCVSDACKRGNERVNGYVPATAD